MKKYTDLIAKLREAARDDCTMGMGYHWNLEDEAADAIEMLLPFVQLLADYIPASAIGNTTVQEALGISSHTYTATHLTELR